jgi:uncharacterized membrane protein
MGDDVLHHVIQVMLLSLAPVVELRIAIPYGIAHLHLHPVVAIAAAVVATWAVIVPMFLIMDLFYKRFLSRVRIIRHIVEEIRARGRGHVERWGVIGVGIYVSLPLPGPGVYSGVVLAWVFGLPRLPAILSLMAGVLVSALLVGGIATPAIHLIRKLMAPSAP